MLPVKRRPPVPAAPSWTDGGVGQQAWARLRAASLRWAVAGGLAGAAFGAVAFAPATWLAQAVATASGERLLLSDAQGTVWSGNALAVLTGGPGSRDATVLPGRLAWTIGLAGFGFDIRATQACCLNGTVVVHVSPGLARWRVTLVPPPDWVGQWPAAWLSGLGTPWNTLALGGSVRLLSPRFALEWVAGRWRIEGQADIELVNVASRLSTLGTLGSYRLRVLGDPAGQAQLNLSTQSGALQLSGDGQWGAGGLRFRGEARAAPADEAALANLLNIIGQRDGARSVIKIG